jgi:hypothetical protein
LVVFSVTKRFIAFKQRKVAFTQSKRSTTASINHFSKRKMDADLRQQTPHQLFGLI